VTLKRQKAAVVAGEWREILELPTAQLEALVKGLEAELKQRGESGE